MAKVGGNNGSEFDALEQRFQEAKKLLQQTEIKVEELQATLDAAAEHLKTVRPIPQDGTPTRPPNEVAGKPKMP